jgi:hypothetical protein
MRVRNRQYGFCRRSLLPANRPVQCSWVAVNDRSPSFATDSVSGHRICGSWTTVANSHSKGSPPDGQHPL